MSVDTPDIEGVEGENEFSEEDLEFFRELTDSDNETLQTVGEVVVQSSMREETSS